jgi:succinyldiaminopimelate transaminase
VSISSHPTAPPARSGPAARSLPDFPWDSLAPYAATARAVPGGVVDLSVGTPVDPTPAVVREALRAAADAPAYPLTAGTPELREAIAGWFTRRCGARADGLGVLPTIGSKELVAWLPTLLGLGPADTVVIPELAYPTYDVGSRLAGATVLRADSTAAVGPAPVALVWVNSPSNPTGRVLPAEHLAKVVAWARERGAVVVSDECYLELGWEAEPVSVLHPDVCGGSYDGILAVHSLSKRSNLAGYRAGYLAGDPALVARLLEVRKHAGMIVPAPVQAAMVAALGDSAHVAEQRARYAARRTLLRSALTGAGFAVEHSEAGLYLWVTRGEDCWATVSWLAERGIVVAPGEFYGPAGRRHVRVALTATDERVATAVERLGA